MEHKTQRNIAVVLCIVFAVCAVLLGVRTYTLTTENQQLATEKATLQTENDSLKTENKKLRKAAKQAQNSTTQSAPEQSGTDNSAYAQEYFENPSYVASVGSDKYHRLSCRYAKNILEENAIYYETANDAELNGKVPCAVCMP